MTPNEIREILERHGLALHKDRGQNFLIDEVMAEKLALLAGVGGDDVVLEIGTGLGALTRALAARAKRVVTLEVDAGLVRALRAEPLLPPNTELRHADALEVDLAGCFEDGPESKRLVTNLPYSISGPALRRFLSLRDQLVDWSVLVQKEVGERLLAGPGGRNYGSLAVLHRLVGEVERCQELAPGCFHPAPKVRSVFLRITPRRDPLVAPGELRRVERVVRAAFASRRKTIANSLRGALHPTPSADELEGGLSAAEISPRARAEQVEPEALLALARALPPAP